MTDSTNTHPGTPEAAALRRAPAALFVVAVLVVAGGLVAYMDLLHRGSHERGEAIVVMRELGVEVVELNAAQREAGEAGEVTPQNAAILAEERRDARSALERLRESDLEPEDYERVERRYEAFAARVSEVIGLVEAGRVERARALSRGDAEAAYEELDGYLEERLQTSEEAAERAEFLGRLGMYGGGLLAALVLIVIFLRHDGASRRNRRSLQESDQRHRSLFEQNPDGVYSLDPRGRVLASNASMTRLLGYTEEEFTGRSAARFIAADQRRASADRFSQALAGVPQNYETALVRKDGGRVEIAMTQVPIVVGGRVTGVYGIAKDITRRLEAERGVRRAEARYRTLVEQIPAVIYIDAVDETNSALYRSPHVVEVLGYAPEEFHAHAEFWQNLLHPDDRERVLAENARTNRTGEPFRIEYRMIRRDGRTVWVRDEAILIRDDGGKPLYWQGVFVDVTERKRTEERLEEAEARYRSIVEQVPVAIYRQNVEDHAISYLSPQIEAMTGYAPDDYMSDPRLWIEILHPEDRERVVAQDRHSDVTGEPFRVEARRFTRDGRVVWLRDEAVLVRSPSGAPLYWQGVTMDVTERKGAEERLEEAEARYRSIVEQVPIAIYRQDVDHDGHISYISPQIERITGYSVEEYTSSPPRWMDTIHAEDRERVLEEDARSDRTGEPFRVEFRKHTPDGRLIWLRDEAVLVRSAVGKPLYWQGVVMDVTERKGAEERLQEAEARYRTLVEQVAAVTYVQEIDHSDTVVYVSPQIEEITGYKPEDFRADPGLWYAVVHPDDHDWVKAEDDRTDGTKEVFRAEYRMVHRNGRVSWVYDEAVLIEDSTGTPRLWQGIMTDITERKNLERRLRHQALHDPLTNLPNRSLFEDRLAHALARSNRRSESVAVLFVDLDNFKYINDSLGHEVGDNLLIAVAARIQGCLRPEDTLARLGGDEFTILIEDISDARDATGVVTRVERGLRAPFVVDGREVFVTASIGIALNGTSQRVRPADLLRQADLAMYAAKDDGKNNHKVFEEAMNATVNRRLSLENDLRRAVDREEFYVLYQPKVSLGAGRITGFEALVRWRHPDRGVIYPSEFITLAEETGLVVPIGRLVLRRACALARRWQDLPRNGHAPPSISVNLSPRQFLEPDLAGTVTRALADSGLAAGALELEITETVLAQDALRAREVLVRLRKLGLRISIDDFGTGYSSLARLRDLPVDSLKIDKSFVAGLGEDRDNGVLVSGMIELAAGLGLDVAAEGVETPRQADLLRSLGCDCAQGFFFGDPVEDTETFDLLLPTPAGTDGPLRARSPENPVEHESRDD